jgi:L-ascorbate metabolism protein UlaG (beta-lactamase superfamily)
VLITHPHGDHLDPETLNGLDLAGAELIAPRAVVEKLGDITFGKVTELASGASVSRHGAGILAVPMYNLPETADSRHPKGWGNGYVITLGSQRVYISGDTEDIPEMRGLKDIDMAFVCMNLPYTMTVEQAADAVLEFKPEVVYPYHYRKGDGTFSDVDQFKALVDAGNIRTAVKLLNWYPEK